MYGQGDICITPAKIPIFARWDSDDHYLRMRPKTQFIQNTARETLTQDWDRLELIPECQIRNPQIEAIAMMLLTEMQQEQVKNKLYVVSSSHSHLSKQFRQFTGMTPKSYRTI